MTPSNNFQSRLRTLKFLKIDCYRFQQYISFGETCTLKKVKLYKRPLKLWMKNLNTSVATKT